MANRRIVICCDGTGNSFERVLEESNVSKLYCTLRNDRTQICYYHPGVGTMGSPKSRGWFENQWSRIKGLAFGSGLLRNVGDAYRFLMDNYADGDEIFLFGFSRGAFTARALASLLHVYGLLCSGNHELIPYILQMYSRKSRAAKHQHRTFASDEPFKWQFSHHPQIRIKFCGLWDTVSSYGWIYDPIELPFLGCNPIIDIGRHAISIHERRCFYQDNLWGEAEPGQDIRQVWFSGVHSDVGGSYLEPTSGLSKVALEWMLVEATKHGLQVNSLKAEIILGRRKPIVPIPGLSQFAAPDKDACLHHSLHGLWWLAEFLPQRDPHKGRKGWCLPLGRRRNIPAGSYIHQSVLDGKWTPILPPEHKLESWVPFKSTFSKREGVAEAPIPLTS